MLGRWDDGPIDPAYYIEDCRISILVRSCFVGPYLLTQRLSIRSLKFCRPTEYVILLWSLLSQGRRNWSRQLGGQGGNRPFHVFADHLTLGTIHLKHLQIFTIFDHYPPSLWQFLTNIRHQFWPIFDPSPTKKNADILTLSDLRLNLNAKTWVLNKLFNPFQLRQFSIFFCENFMDWSLS